MPIAAPRLSSPRLALTCNSCVDTVESQSFHSHPAASPPTIASVVAATSFALISVRSKDMNANSTSLAHIRCDTPLAMPGKTSMSEEYSKSKSKSWSRSRTRLFRPLGACQRYATLGKRMKRKRTSDKCCLRVVRFYCALKADRKGRGGVERGAEIAAKRLPRCVHNAFACLPAWKGLPTE